MCVWGGVLVAWIIWIHPLDKLEKQSCWYNQKRCICSERMPSCVDNFPDGVNKPLSVVESYCFSPMSISLWFVPFSFIVKFCNGCTQLKCGTSEELWEYHRLKRRRSNENDRHKRFLLKTIRKRQLQYFFFWHLIRADGLEKQILSGKICGTILPKAKVDNAQNTQCE